MPPYRDLVIADGAVAYWRLGETSGTTANSEVGTYPGTISGGVLLGQPGALADGNAAMQFDGANDRITVALGAYSAFGTGPLSVEWWMRATGPTGYGFLWTMVNGNGVQALIDPTGIYFQAVVGGTTSTCAIPFTYTDGVWHHVVCTVTRGPDTMRLYIDGTLQQTATLTPTGGTLTTTNPLRIGNLPSVGYGFSGWLDEVAFYKTALTATQITAHYAARAYVPATTGRALLNVARLNAFRLGYLQTALFPVRATRIRVTINGTPVRVRHNSITIRDALNDSPNTCTLIVDGPEPQRAQALRITINADAPRVLFSGALQKVDVTYTGRPSRPVYPCQAIDDTPRANARLPFGSWTNLSATTLAQQLVATFAPTLGYTHVQAGLPPVSVNLDGSEGMNGALTQIAKLIGGYYYWDDRDLHLFQGEEPGEAPDPIDTTPHRFLDDPHITVMRDDSQIRTRVYGKGHGEATLTEVAVGESIIPIANAVMFNPAGGQAITLTQRLAYTGLQLGGGGGLVGPGAQPSTAPSATLLNGTGIDVGTHQYAVTFVTASGESLASPLLTVVIASSTSTSLADPDTAPGAAQASGTGIETGTHQYAVTFLNSAGETLPSPVATVNHVPTVPDPTVPGNPADDTNGGALTKGATYQWCYTYRRTSDGAETAPSPAATWTVGATGGVKILNLPIDPNGFGYRWYRTKANGSTFYYNSTIGMTPAPPAYTLTAFDKAADADLTVPMPTTVGAFSVNRTTINPVPKGPAGTISRRIYRTVANGAQLRLLTTIADNATTTYLDAASDTTLGANAPTSNTTTIVTALQQVQLSTIPVGPSGTTSRNIYRTKANAGTLLILGHLFDNTTTTLFDAQPDSALTAPSPPATDSSGLSQPSGQVPAGATSIIVAGTGPFPPTGWAVIGNGTQTIRYTGVTPTALTGIPASGPGAITATVAYNSSITAAPVLTGVTGIGLPLKKGDPVNIWVQRDDVAAQAELAAREGTADWPSDGIRERRIVDERRGEASLRALCDADLIQFSRGITTVAYATHDVKTKAGKPVYVNLPSPAITDTLTIQDVTITDLDVAPSTPPKFTVTASNVRFSLEDLLRQLGGYLEGL